MIQHQSCCPGPNPQSRPGHLGHLGLPPLPSVAQKSPVQMSHAWSVGLPLGHPRGHVWLTDETESKRYDTMLRRTRFSTKVPAASARHTCVHTTSLEYANLGVGDLGGLVDTVRQLEALGFLLQEGPMMWTTTMGHAGSIGRIIAEVGGTGQHAHMRLLLAALIHA